MRIPREPERYELEEGPLYVFHVTRREFLGAAGLLLIAAQSAAQRDAATLEARLHLGEDGRVTVFTGKIEEGQGARTELAMAAAEELRVRLSQVDVVMADTDRVPNDGITAGSRTTPATVPLLRRAAAAARELLIAGAAQRWNADLAALEVRDGAVMRGADRFSYVDLARTQPWTEAHRSALPPGTRLQPPTDWRLLGTPVNRVNSRDLVTGQHQFPSDVARPGMLYGAVVRPPSFGASLESIDLEPAKRRPGVIAVRDGDFVACAAPTSFEARKAAVVLAAGARWKEKQHPSSSGLFSYLKEHPQAGAAGRSRPIEQGDLTRALAEAGKRLQATYTAAYIQHAPMEPRAAVAEWQQDRLTVWTGTSNPFAVRDQLAQAFRILPANVRVIVPDMGGGFGGKHTGEAAIEAARLAREAGKPVSLRWSRAEEFAWAYARPAALIEIEAGLSGSGRLEAWDFVNYNSGSAAIATPYTVPHQRIRYVPCDSPLRQGSYRALASTANNFARECFMDELAQAAGSDPLAFRLQHLGNARIRAVLEAAVERFGWKDRAAQRKPNRGLGLACGTEKDSVVAACVEVEIDPRSSTPKVLEICQAFECGAILNPAGLRAQVEGCILMGLGGALFEELQFANGRLTNGRFSTYRVPRFRDVPKMDLVFLDKREAPPVGAGETPIIAVAPAIANAVFAAGGGRLRAMPLRMGSRHA
jgi:isoquinoline 1-oxidoreductase